MLEEIRKKVQSKVNAGHKQIILGVYLNLIKAHNDFCSCDYCNILKEYVRTKKYLTSYTRKLYTYDYDCHETGMGYQYTVVRDLQRRISELKLQKDKLKMLP